MYADTLKIAILLNLQSVNLQLLNQMTSNAFKGTIQYITIYMGQLSCITNPTRLCGPISL